MKRLFALYLFLQAAVVWAQPDPTSLPWALNTPDWVWQTNATGWFPQNVVTHDFEAAAQAAPSVQGETNSMETLVQGPGTVRFFWRSISTDKKDKLAFYVNGSSKKSLTGSNDWQLVTYSASSTSTQRLRWDFVRSSSSTASNLVAYVDQVSFGTSLPPLITTQPKSATILSGKSIEFSVSVNGSSSLKYQWQIDGTNALDGNGLRGSKSSKLKISSAQPSHSGDYTVIVTNSAGAATSIVARLVVIRVITLAEAMDAPSNSWKTSGSPAWFGQTNISHDAEDAAQGGGIGSGKSVYFSTSVTGPGTVSFWWKVSSATNNGVLLFQIGSTDKAQISGEVDWVQAGPFAVPAGSQTLKWTYKKSNSTVAGADAAWVDQYSFQPPPVLYNTNSGYLPDTNQIANVLTLANDYYIANNTRQTNGWARGVYQAGNVRAYQVLGTQRYYDWAVQWGNFFNWQPGWRGPTNADGEVCGQAYIDLYKIDPQAIRIAGVQAGIDNRVATAALDDWWWIDAFFMAGPVYARFGNLYQTNSYFDELSRLYTNMKVQRGLYDSSVGLWYRDADAQKAKTKNGKKQFWGRGNGWVIAACVRVLEQNPLSPAHQAEYGTMLQSMAAVLKPLQGTDGFWRASLIDAAEVPNPETSCTALFTYALAWGIRNGYLDAAEYGPVVAKAWNGLVKIAFHPDGKVGYAQPQGKLPEKATYDDTSDHGVGAFLLAGSEVLLLARAIPNDPTLAWSALPPETREPVAVRITNSGDSVLLRWKVSPGRTYRVVYKDELEQEWTSLDTEILVLDTEALATDSVGGRGQRFYQVEEY